MVPATKLFRVIPRAKLPKFQRLGGLNTNNVLRKQSSVMIPNAFSIGSGFNSETAFNVSSVQNSFEHLNAMKQNVLNNSEALQTVQEELNQIAVKHASYQKKQFFGTNKAFKKKLLHGFMFTITIKYILQQVEKEYEEMIEKGLLDPEQAKKDMAEIMSSIVGKREQEIKKLLTMSLDRIESASDLAVSMKGVQQYIKERLEYKQGFFSRGEENSEKVYAFKRIGKVVKKSGEKILADDDYQKLKERAKELSECLLKKAFISSVDSIEHDLREIAVDSIKKNLTDRVRSKDLIALINKYELTEDGLISNGERSFELASAPEEIMKDVEQFIKLKYSQVLEKNELRKAIANILEKTIALKKEYPNLLQGKSFKIMRRILSFARAGVPLPYAGAFGTMHELLMKPMLKKVGATIADSSESSREAFVEFRNQAVSEAGAHLENTGADLLGSLSPENKASLEIIDETLRTTRQTLEMSDDLARAQELTKWVSANKHNMFLSVIGGKTANIMMNIIMQYLRVPTPVASIPVWEQCRNVLIAIEADLSLRGQGPEDKPELVSRKEQRQEEKQLVIKNKQKRILEKKQNFLTDFDTDTKTAVVKKYGTNNPAKSDPVRKKPLT